jgi:hypothetical protein
MPRAELIFPNEPNKPKYIKALSQEEMIVLIKDKFFNWKDLVSLSLYPYLINS